MRMEATDIPTTRAATPPFTTLPASQSTHPPQIESSIHTPHDSSKGQENNPGSAHEVQKREGHLERTNTLRNRIPEWSVGESSSSAGLVNPNMDRGTRPTFRLPSGTKESRRGPTSAWDLHSLFLGSVKHVLFTSHSTFLNSATCHVQRRN